MLLDSGCWQVKRIRSLEARLPFEYSTFAWDLVLLLSGHEATKIVRKPMSYSTKAFYEGARLRCKGGHVLTAFANSPDAVGHEQLPQPQYGRWQHDTQSGTETVETDISECYAQTAVSVLAYRDGCDPMIEFGKKRVTSGLTSFCIPQASHCGFFDGIRMEDNGQTRHQRPRIVRRASLLPDGML